MANLDIEIFRLINNLASTLKFLNPLMIFLAKYSIFVLALFMIYLWFTKRNMRKTLIASVLLFIVAEIFAKVLGIFIEHVQPFATLDNVNQLITKEVNNSFPSDHTVLAFSICFTLFLGSKNKWRFLYLLVATFIGISRIWVGVHYPIDVLAGALLGIIIPLLLYFPLIKNKIFKKILKLYNHIEYKITKKKPSRHRKQ